ncbi:MAG TPA: hypothetical protein VHZ26_13600 [Caulobacteraceae bacterium]|jgi:hypothetical protein|nr:hypothetical protein [Caulobacteraceae bacterium]
MPAMDKQDAEDIKHLLEQLIAAVLVTATVTPPLREEAIIRRYRQMRQSILQDGGL